MPSSDLRLGPRVRKTQSRSMCEIDVTRQLVPSANADTIQDVIESWQGHWGLAGPCWLVTQREGVVVRPLGWRGRSNIGKLEGD
jgi:hypothetical protein